MDADSITGVHASQNSIVWRNANERREPRSRLAKRAAAARIRLAGGAAGTARARRTDADGRRVVSAHRRSETHRGRAEEVDGWSIDRPEDHRAQEDRREEAGPQADRSEEGGREEARWAQGDDREEEDDRPQEDGAEPREEADPPTSLEVPRGMQENTPSDERTGCFISRVTPGL